MKNQRQKDTSPELAIRSLLFQRGFRYRLHKVPVKGLRCRADLVFGRERVAVFVNGCFWHVCPIHGTWPKANGDWWRDKLEGNIRRDQRVDAGLRDNGWVSLRIWEHEKPEAAVDKIAATLIARRKELNL